MLRRFKQARKIIGIGLLASSAFAFFYSAQYEILKLATNYYDPLSITEYRLKNLSTDEFIAEIQNSIAENKLSEAAEIVDIAQEYGHQIPQELVDETKEGYFDTTVRWGKDFTNGFIYGNMNSGQGIAGTIISDLVLIGDLRDLGVEGTKLYNGDDYDSITLGMSAAGATTSIIALTSAAGALTASTLDNSISIMKTAHKFGKLSKKMTANISRITADAVDFKKLKQSIGSVSSVAKMPSPTSIMKAVRKVDLKDVANGNTDDITKAFIEVIPLDLKAASNLTDGLVSPKALKEISDLAGSNAAVIKSGGFRTSFKALEIADDAKDMTKISTIAAKYGNKTATVLKVLGKKAYKLGKLLYLIGAIIVGIIGWLLYAVWLAFSTAKGTVRLIHRAGKRV